MFTPEILVYLILILVGVVSVSLFANIGIVDSLFHVVSMSSATGYQYIPLASFGGTALSILTILMLIGGCAFSMSGGIRVSRIIAFGQSVKENVTGILNKERTGERFYRNGNSELSLENLSASVSILLFIFTLVIFALIFTTSGVSFIDSIFEVGSALTTNGISMGATTLTMGIGYKWLIIAAMTIGRVEMLSIIVALFSLRRR